MRQSLVAGIAMFPCILHAPRHSVRNGNLCFRGSWCRFRGACQGFPAVCQSFRETFRAVDLNNGFIRFVGVQ